MNIVALPPHSPRKTVPACSYAHVSLLLLGALYLWAGVCSARAATLLQYTFTGSTASPSTVAAGLVATDIIPGAGLPGGFATLSGNTVKVTPVIQANAISLAQAQANNDFFTITIRPQSGMTVNLDNFTMKAFTTVANGSDSPAKNYAVYSSLDGFITSTMLTSGIITTSSVSYPATPQTITVPVAGTAFDSLTAATEFRVYVWGGTGYGQGTRFDDVLLEGSVSSGAGGIVAAYNFEGGSLAPSTVAANVVPSDFRAGVGLQDPAPGPNLITLSGIWYVSTGVVLATATDLAGAKVANDYYTITLTPQSGASLNLDRFTFTAFVSTPGMPANQFAVLSSSDSFTTPLVTGTVTSISSTNPQTITVPVDGSEFDDITSPVEFRLYIWGGQGYGAGTRWDNFEFSWGNQPTIGGGTIDSPAVGPDASYGLGIGAVLVKNWDFGTNGTIKNMDDLNTNFAYHDQFGQYNNGNGNYGAPTVAPNQQTAVSGQPIEGTVTGGQSVREIFSDYLRTYLVPLNGATTVKPSDHNVGCGSFVAKWELPNGGSLLGKDIIWETRVRYVVPPYFWFAIWTAGNQWQQGAEMDLVESFGYDNGGSNTNFEGDYWHSNNVGGYDDIYYASGWPNVMASLGITSFDSTQYHIWTWVYRADNTFTSYMDGIAVQSGSIYWTFRGDPNDSPVDMTFLFDGSWGHTKVGKQLDENGQPIDFYGPVDNYLAASELVGKFYEWDYSRVYLRDSTASNAPLMETMELAWTSDVETWEHVSISQPFTNPVVIMSPASSTGSDPCHARVRNATYSGFDYTLEEWDYLDGAHSTDETFYCLVLDAGLHDVGGLTFEAGIVNSVTNNWQVVTLAHAFASPPVILAQVASDNDGSAVVARLRNVTTTSFEVRVQEEEAADGLHAGETIHYLAAERGTMDANGLKLLSSSTTKDSTSFWLSFSSAYNNPFFFGSIQTFNGGDPAGLRFSGLNEGGINLKVEEEASADSETWHTTEDVGYLVIGE